MRFDLHVRQGVKEQIESLVGRMRDWEAGPRLDRDQIARLRAAIQPFEHTTTCGAGLRLAGVDGTGDYPALAYADSFVYITLAQATCYQASPLSGLREVGPAPEPLLHFAWVPQDEGRRKSALDDAFAALAGEEVEAVLERSDYRLVKARATGRAHTVSSLRAGLILPQAADAGNLEIQLRSAGELGAALRMLKGGAAPCYLLMDGTLSLPLVSHPANSLFYEHLKRLCCVEARARGIGFFSLSKSHGLPSVETVEEAARERLGLERGKVAEHWYFRIPERGMDGWELSLTEGRRLPPPGAVTYLGRFHRTTPVLRLEMDREYWSEYVRGETEEETREAERWIFGDLDYASHDQRCYGYPYPVKAGHDRASLTQAERAALRKQIVEAAVRAGMKRSLFRSAAQASGHE